MSRSSYVLSEEMGLILTGDNCRNAFKKIAIRIIKDFALQIVVVVVAVVSEGGGGGGSRGNTVIKCKCNFFQSIVYVCLCFVVEAVVVLAVVVADVVLYIFLSYCPDKFICGRFLLVFVRLFGFVWFIVDGWGGGGVFVVVVFCLFVCFSLLRFLFCFLF